MTFTGKLDGNDITFSRSARILPGGHENGGGGGGIYSTSGPMRFVATRDATAPPNTPRLLYGQWKLNLEKSKGSPQFFMSVIRFDGKEYPTHNNLTVAVLVVRATAVDVLSEDGNTLTETVNNFGPPSTETLVFDRQ